MNPFFSIITVCYNSQSTISRTIESVLNQSFKNFEYIIIDGKSTDSTLQIINNYSNDANLQIISESDSGIYNAMNKGILKSTGKYINIINSDDWYDENILEDMHNFILMNNYPEIVHGNIIVVNDNKNKLYIPRSNRSILFWYGMSLYHPTFFVKNQIYKSNNFDEKYRISSDYKFTFKEILNGTNFQYYNRVVAHTTPGGASSVFIKRIIEGHFIRKDLNFNIIIVYISTFYRFIRAIFSMIKNKV